MAKRRRPTTALVILECGDYDPNQHLYDSRVLYIRTVDCDPDGRIGQLKECTLYGLRLHAWAAIERKSFVNRFLKATKSVKGAHIHGNWFRVAGTDIPRVVEFMHGDVVFGEGHRLAYLKDALDCKASFARKLARACEAASVSEL